MQLNTRRTDARSFWDHLCRQPKDRRSHALDNALGENAINPKESGLGKFN